MRRAIFVALLVIATSAPAPAQREAVLANASIRAVFGPRGLASITAARPHHCLPAGRLRHLDRWPDLRERRPCRLRRELDAADRVTFTWTAGPYRLLTTYELESAWSFISKQVAVIAAPGATYRVDDVRVFDARLGEPVQDVYVPKSVRPNLGTGDYGGAIRLGGQRGLLAVVQNPFLEFAREQDAFSIRYKPDMEWRAENGPFLSDRGMLAPYRLTGRVQPDRMMPEWRLESPQPIGSGMDEGEIAAFTNLVRELPALSPGEAAQPDGRLVRERLPDRRRHCPRDAPSTSASSIAPRSSAPTTCCSHRRTPRSRGARTARTTGAGSTRSGSGSGRRSGKGEWDPRTDAVPASRAGDARLREAEEREARRLRLSGRCRSRRTPSGSSRAPDRPNRKYASLGVRSLQDWLIEELVAFQQQDRHRRLRLRPHVPHLRGHEPLRAVGGLAARDGGAAASALPDIAIDGRQAYHLYGPWSLAGRQLSAPDVQRRAARELRAVSRTCISIACRRIASATRRIDTASTISRPTRSCPGSPTTRRRAGTTRARCRSCRRPIAAACCCRSARATGTTSAGATRCCRRSRRPGGTTC